jgi:hypothetical protein
VLPVPHAGAGVHGSAMSFASSLGLPRGTAGCTGTHNLAQRQARPTQTRSHSRRSGHWPVASPLPFFSRSLWRAFMKMTRVAVGVALMMVIANAVFAQNVKTDYNPGTNFAAYKTFMWIKEPKTTNPLMKERVMNDINEALTARGLKLVTSDADLCIAAHAATTEERTLNTFYDGFGGGWRWGGGFGSATTTTSTYEVGTLVVDLFDAKTKDAIWRGTASKTLSENPQKNAENLNKAIEKMFKNFPPATRAKAN